MKRFLFAILLSLALSPLAAIAGGSVNVNTADAAELETVRGIGPSKAAAIVAYRDTNGPFASVDELVKVPGIGERTLEQMREHLTTDENTSGQ